MLEADSDAFADDIMKPFLKEYNDIDQQKKKKKKKNLILNLLAI